MARVLTARRAAVAEAPAPARYASVGVTASICEAALEVGAARREIGARRLVGCRAGDREARLRSAPRRDVDGLRIPPTHGAVARHAAQGHRVAPGVDAAEGGAAVRADRVARATVER